MRPGQKGQAEVQSAFPGALSDTLFTTRWMYDCAGVSAQKKGNVLKKVHLATGSDLDLKEPSSGSEKSA